MKRFFVIFFLFAASVSYGARAADNSADVPTVYMVANAHFDTQWRWTVRTSIDEYLFDTMVQNFALLDKYPDYVFNFEGGVKYAWMKEYYPELFERLRKYVASGRWHISGASWDATDPNLPSIESGIRNIMLGQRFYREEFGVLSTDIMLPDCFGFGCQLPSIAAHCGLIGFGTQKLGWRQKPFYANGMKYPFHFGIWKGLDGSRVMAALDGGGYAWSPDAPITDWPGFHKVFSYFSDVPAIYRYFGTGDRGGSGTPNGVRFIEDAVRNPGLHYKVRFAASDDMFKDFLWDERLQEYSGELLMDVHATGCYTSKAEMKNLNRRNEWMLGSAEAVSVMADWLGGVKYPSYTIDNGWKRIIWHQFHDDLTGTSIPEAYQFSYNDEYVNLAQMNGVVESGAMSASSLLDTRVKGVPYVVYNPISADNPGLAEVRLDVPASCRSVDVFAPSGRKLRSQIVGREGDRAVVAFAGVDPSLSLSVYGFRPSERKEAVSGVLKATENGMENRIYRISFDANGDISSIVDKRCGRELVRKGESFSLAFFDNNVSASWPAWEIIKGVIDRKPSAVDGEVRISVEECGPLRACVRIERKRAGSTFVQRVMLTDGAADDRIDVVNTVDWRSRASLLKASFPLAFDAPEAVYDMGMGHIARGNNTDTAYEVFAHQWADMSAPDGSYGVTVMNDSKYGWDKPDDHTIRLTLLHTPETGRNYSEQATQDLGVHTFTYSIVGHPGALDPAATDIKADCLNQAKFVIPAESHPGPLGKCFSMARSTNPNLRIKALKKAQDGDGIVVRLYEMSGKGASGNIVFPAGIVSAERLDGIEDSLGEAGFSGKSLEVSQSGFALGTYRVRLADPAQKVAGPDYETLSLPYNVVAITTDDFATMGRIGKEKRSYAAEILPERLEYRGIPFTFGEPDYPDAVRCEGQALSVPEGVTRIHLLVAADNGGSPVDAVFKLGDGTCARSISDCAGFYGVYGWPGYYESSLRSDDVAYVGTHTHRIGVRNDAYSFTYMYLVSIPVEGVSELKLPEGGNVIVLSATSEKAR